MWQEFLNSLNARTTIKMVWGKTKKYNGNYKFKTVTYLGKRRKDDYPA